MSDVNEYLLPDVGEGLTEAEIVTWKVKVGDEIKVNDVVVEIETAKSLVELPSPYAGTVLALLVPEGETVPVGTPIIRVGDPAASDAPVPAAPDLTAMDLSNPAASGGVEGESLVGRNKAERGPVRRARRRSGPDAAGVHAAKADVHDAYNAGAPQQHDQVAQLVDTLLSDAAQQATTGAAVAATAPATTRALAKPPVRKLAKELGVDLGSCAASGPAGTVTRADVEAAVGTAVGAPALSRGHRDPATDSDERSYREPI